MSQFRTVADILDEILQEAGEPTNGNSPFETIARTYANQVHHAIINGGTIFNLNVDEPWVWARARHPITLELEVGVTASITATADSTNISFSTAQAASVKGWHLQADGKRTVYKIMNHTAGSVTAQLDSGFIDSAGTYTVRAFKLDYDIAPTYYYIDSSNDRLNFQETAATTYTASLSHGTYTPTTLLSHVFGQMTAAGTGTVAYGGTFDTVTRFFNITASVSFKMLFASGADYRRSIGPMLGFDVLDQTGAQTYSGAYTPNAISRLIEPFKVHAHNQQMIYSTDPIRLEEDYPIAYTKEAIPARFARLYSDREGGVTVRFNSYPRDKTKVQIPWIQRPVDLQDNTASVVMLPREDIKTFIHCAVAHLMYDKEDTKYEGMLKLAGAGLEAMRNKNRLLLQRTGENFGQIIPREDLLSRRANLKYGYTAGSD